MKPNPFHGAIPPTQTFGIGGARGHSQLKAWLYGTVFSVEPSREMLSLLRPEAGKPEIVHWLPETRFLDQGLQIKPESLHRGQHIAVQYCVDGDQKFALEIDIGAAAPVKTSTSQQRQALWPLHKQENKPTT